MKVDNGYLIVEKYEFLYEKYKESYQLTSERYAIPRIDRNPSDYQIHYRGIDRDCLIANPWEPRNQVEKRLGEIFVEFHNKEEANEVLSTEEQGFLEDDFIPKKFHKEVYKLLGGDASKYETIFVRKVGVNIGTPQNFIFIGFEPSNFYSDHFSASCDCMLIPRWHGTDKEGILFKVYFDQLNSFGLFDSQQVCEEFLKYYLSFDWTETGDFYTTEVFIENEEKID